MGFFAADITTKMGTSKFSEDERTRGNWGEEGSNVKKKRGEMSAGTNLSRRRRIQVAGSMGEKGGFFWVCFGGTVKGKMEK